MSRDPFAFINAGGGLTDNPALIAHVSIVRMKREQAINAYRRYNIALPDVHIADRNDKSQPKVLAEDGTELTPEKREEMMRGVPKMVDDNGELRKDVNYIALLDDKIKSERLGKSAEENRHPIRVVQPRELEIHLTDVDYEDYHE